MIPGIAHIFAICDARFEPERYAAMEIWLSSTFPSDYYSFDFYCWGSTVTREDLQQYGISMRPSLSEASLILNHLKILEKFCEHYDPADRILVLESDAMPVEGWMDTLSVQLAKLETQQWDVFQIGNGCSLTPKRFDHTISAEPDVYLCPATRCTDSIIWNRRGAEAVLRCRNIDLPIDHHLNRLINEVPLRVYWGHPSLIVQGSQNGTYATSIDHKRNNL